MTGNTSVIGNTKDVKTILPLKFLSNFWKTLEMPLINCEVNVILTWSSAYVITNSTGGVTFAITHTKFYVKVITLSTQDNAKFLQKLKSGFKGTINWNKYQTDPKTYAQNEYLNHLVDPSFQGINRRFVGDGRISHSEYYLQKVKIKDYNAKIGGENLLDQQ